MSSANLVRVAFIEETVYGQTPGVGNFETARFTSEALSGSPETTESAQIRVDRQSSGQVVTSLTLGGDLNFELASEAAVDLFLESAMLNNWVVDTPITVDLDLDVTARTITRTSGDFNVDVEVGDFIELSGFVNAENNTQVQVASIDSATVITVVLPTGLVDETGSGTSFRVSDKLTIGTTQKSFSMEKSFLDLTTKAINYRGMLVNTMSLNVAYGELVNGTFGFSGSGYDPVESAAGFMTNARTVNGAATTNTFNGSIDMPIIANSATGTFEDSTFCIQSINLELNNNYTAQTCIGLIAPDSYNAGTAAITVSLTAYLADDNWNFLEKKQTQEPFAIGFQLKNVDGWYGFYLPAVQVTFDDPASGGQNEDVLLDASGTAKVGANGESQLVIFRPGT
jgi:hypothetical protein